MPDIPGRAYVGVPDTIIPIVGEIIVSWGKLDDTMDELRLLLRDEPACVGMRPKMDHSSFPRRFTEFEALSRKYFEPTPAMVQIVNRKCDDIRRVKGDREFIAHGVFGMHTGDGEPVLQIRIRKGDAFEMKKYTFAEFAAVLDQIRKSVRFLIGMGQSSFDADRDNLLNNWKIPSAQVDQLEKLMRHIQGRYLESIRSRFHKSPQ
jgi:hypothetical protein